MPLPASASGEERDGMHTISSFPQFGEMVEEGERQLKSASQSGDFFAIFGESEAENSRLSAAYTIRGPGFKGLGERLKAKEDLNKAVELLHSNLWAAAELQENI